MQAPTREELSAEAKRLLEGLSGGWVAERMGVSDATVGAWRRGTRVPDLGAVLLLAIITRRPLAPEIDAQVEELLEAGRIVVRATEEVIESAEEEAGRIVDEAERPRRRRGGSRRAEHDAAEGGPGSGGRSAA